MTVKESTAACSEESAVAAHYGDADLLARIRGGLKAAGLDETALRAEDLAPVDEFHIGGREATVHAVAKMGLNAGMSVLDVGCGIGGAARYLAAEIGCRVSGIDLTPDYIAAAKALTDMTGLSDKIAFETASALDMPFEDAAFHAAITIHVAMNIAARAELYAEIARVLKPGAVFCAYDVMKMNGEDLTFPVPWAETPATSFLATPDDMRGLLDAAGFEVLEVEERRVMAIEFFERRIVPPGTPPPPLGVHLVMGESAPVKFKNTLENLRKGRIAPVVMIARRR